MLPLVKKTIKDTDQYKLLLDMEAYFKNKLWKKLTYAHYNDFSIIDQKDEDRIRFSYLFHLMKQSRVSAQILNLSILESRGIGCLLGLAIADALGATTQFIPFDKYRKNLIKNGFEDVINKIKSKILQPRAGQVGVWTDDCSMALCIADSLLLKQFKFDPIHIRYMFLMWLEHGLDNGRRPRSIGLGGNIAISMKQFIQIQTEYADEGTKFNNGNGSLMRLAPIPMAYHNNEQQTMKYCELQSRTTHNGDQASECCKLMGLIIHRLLNRKEHQNWRLTFDKACDQFKTDMISVYRLSKSQRQSEQEYFIQKQSFGTKFTKFNKHIDDRNWNWRDKNFTYSETRNKQQPGYIGSYCMDALAMALHIVLYTKSFNEAVIWSANMGGDCDTVGAIAGQIAGAAYGISDEMLQLYSQMLDFQTGSYEVFLKGLKLISRRQI